MRKSKKLKLKSKCKNGQIQRLPHLRTSLRLINSHLREETILSCRMTVALPELLELSYPRQSNRWRIWMSSLIELCMTESNSGNRNRISRLKTSEKPEFKHARIYWWRMERQLLFNSPLRKQDGKHLLPTKTQRNLQRFSHGHSKYFN